MRTLTRSFAGGEITPELFGRLDLTHYQTGLAECENMIVLPHGPVTCRPGFEYVLDCGQTGPVRLIPFSFNTEQTYVLELEPGGIHVHTNGSTLLDDTQTITSITSANPGVATYTGADPPSGKRMYLSSVANMGSLEGRFVKALSVNTGAKTFKLYDLYGHPIDTSGYTASTGASMNPVFRLITSYSGAHLFELNFIQNADVLTIVHPSYPPAELRRTSANSFTLTNIDFAPSIAAPTGLAITNSGSGSVGFSYVVTAVAESNFEESLPCTTLVITGAALSATVYNTVTWVGVAGALRYNVYKLKDGIYGYVGQAAGTSFKDDNIEPDYSITPPEDDDPLAAVDEYPAAVSYFEQRRVFGNTNTSPLGFWFTRSGTENNMCRSLPIRADDSIRGRVVAREVNEIRHFVPLAELLVLTSGGEWVVSSSDGGALTATTMHVRPQSYEGCSRLIPQVTGSSVLYIQAANKRVFDIAYSWQNNSYLSSDVSLLVPHMLDDYTLVDTAFTRSPDQTLWCVRSDGVLLGMTYIPKQEVNGWHRHTTDGEFKSVCSVIEDGVNVLYAVVRRTVNGATVQYIERMHERRFADVEDWFGVDAGATYEGLPVSTISTGLWHLEGCEVDVLADGAWVSGLTVNQGSITLETPASKVHVGLPYAPIVKPLPVTFDGAGNGVGQVKNVNSVYLRVSKSSAVQAGRTLDTLHTYPQRTVEPYGTPPDLISEEIQIPVEGPWDSDASLYITNQGPLPLTLVSMGYDVEVGD